MSRTLLTTCAVFVAAFTASSTTSWAASVPKQGKIDVAVTDATTAKSLDLGGERTLYVLDSTLVARGDGADAVMHNTAGHCLAFEEVENATGAGRADARCTFVDGDGDKIHTTVKLARTSGKEEAKGTATITGGTGKYAGMSGELTQTRLLLGSPAEGVYPGAGRITGTYTIK